MLVHLLRIYWRSEEAELPFLRKLQQLKELLSGDFQDPVMGANVSSVLLLLWWNPAVEVKGKVLNVKLCRELAGEQQCFSQLCFFRFTSATLCSAG